MYLIYQFSRLNESTIISAIVIVNVQHTNILGNFLRSLLSSGAFSNLQKDLFIAKILTDNKNLYDTMEIREISPYYHMDHTDAMPNVNIDTDTFKNIGRFRKRVGNFYVNPQSGKKLSRSGLTRLIHANLKELDTELVLYTDGSLIPASGAGFGVCSTTYEFRESIPTANKQSIFTVEARAILHALSLFKKSNYRSVSILTDSLAVLRALQNLPNSSRKAADIIFDIQQALHIISQIKDSITLVWVPGHMEVAGNELADMLAKLAASSTEPPAIEHGPIAEDIIGQIRNEMLTIFNNKLNEEFKYKGKRYWIYNKGLSTKLWYKDSKIQHASREIVSLMARFRTHHLKVETHLHNKNIIDYINCSCGAHIRDMEHLLFKCPLTKEQSDKLIADLYRVGIQSLDEIIQAAFDSYLPPFNSIATFLHSTKQCL